MPTISEMNDSLISLLSLTSPPVAVTFAADEPTPTTDVSPEPAGCCFWAPAQHTRLNTVREDHANCSVGSYTHGFIPLEQAAAGADTAALLASGWVGEADLMGAAALPFTPAQVTYEPLSQAKSPDVVLVRLAPTSLMTLSGAVPELRLVAKPQCVIVPLAYSGDVAVSPGCAVSRTRTDLPADELTCAIPAGALDSIVGRLQRSTAADRAVSEFAAADMAANFGR